MTDETLLDPDNVMDPETEKSLSPAGRMIKDEIRAKHSIIAAVEKLTPASRCRVLLDMYTAYAAEDDDHTIVSAPPPPILNVVKDEIP